MVVNRVRVFVDYRNLYGGARDRLLTPSAPRRAGHIAPVTLASLLCSRLNPYQSSSEQRVLEQVRVYSRRPDATRDPRTYGAHRRQCHTWERSGAVVITRPLRYPREWPRARAEEKGIDVQLAYDTGVICSTDTDLLPALEFVATRYGRERAETAAWFAGGKGSELRLRRPSTWCHRLELPDYEVVRDPTDYAR